LFAVPGISIVAASQPSMTSLLPRLFISMAVVLVVMWLAARFLKNRQFPGAGMRIPNGSGNKREPIVQLLGRQGVGKGASVSVVRAGDKTLVIGVTDNNVTLLGEIDHIDLATQSEPQRTVAPVASAPTADVASARKGLLEQVREMTVRKA
jgi:flagellar protein FliO/FliZ